MIRLFILLVGFFHLLLAYAGSITSATITTATLAALPSCLHYQVKGVCSWLTDTGVTITTPYVQHYLPDVVVSVFNPLTDQDGSNAWFEINGTLDQAGKVTEEAIVSAIAHVKAGGGEHGFENPLQQNVFFKEADIIGNPALPLLPTTPALLTSVATPLKPYYQSMLDAALWRGFSPQADAEQADAIVEDITRYIGNSAGAITWGGALPFEGKIQTTNDAKAAAVIAQRTANLLTAQNSWAHLYQSLSTNCGTECKAAVITENNNQTQFQLVYPTQETTCQIFGQTSTYGENFETAANGAYIWVLWRQYEGCIPGQGTFINKVIF